jgi:hypothetical protein
MEDDNLAPWLLPQAHCVKDPKAAVAQRLRACELQAIIGGFNGGQNVGRNESKSGSSRNGQETPSRQVANAANINRLRELLKAAPTPQRTGDHPTQPEPVLHT